MTTKMKSLGASALFAAVLSGVASCALAADVTVSVLQYQQIDDPDGIAIDLEDGPDESGHGDYYPRVRIGANSFERRRSTFQEASTVVAFQSRPDWSFTEEVPDGQIVSVTIQMWDADQLDHNDEIMDLNPSDDIQEVVALLNLATCSWTIEGVDDDFISVVEGDGDREHFGGAITPRAGSRGRLFFNIACGPSADTDGDGLPDTMELQGIFGSDGTRQIDLPALGADPCREDLVVVVDFMEGDAAHTHRPTDNALDLVRRGFASADRTSVSEEDCPYAGFPRNDTGIGLITVVREDPIPEQASMTMNDLSRLANLRIDRFVRPFVHYGVFAHDVVSSMGSTGSSGRCCRNATDFVVSLGSFAGLDGNGNPQNGTDAQQAGTFMHEFGHALGFAHWGRSRIDLDQSGNPLDTDNDGTPDGANCKPNYLSVMNYLFQFSGLIDDDTGSVRFDYSTEVLPSLDESSLSEPSGIGNGSTQTAWCGPSQQLVASSVRGDTAIDWDQSGSATGTGVTVDIAATTASGGSCCQRGSSFAASPGQVLSGFDDWNALSFRVGLGAGVGAENEDFDNEPTAEDAEAIGQYWENRLRCSPPEAGVWVISQDCRIWRDAVAPDDLVITNGATLRLTDGIHLEMDLASHALRIEPGGRFEVDPGARIE